MITKNITVRFPNGDYVVIERVINAYVKDFALHIVKESGTIGGPPTKHQGYSLFHIVTWYES